MATIKMCTDIPQSKKLAEFLPLESADMCYRYYSGGMITGYGDCVLAKSFITGKNVIRENDFPCWSLAALLNILHNKAKDIPSLSGGGYKDGKYTPDWCLDYEFENGDYKTTFADNPVDACYEMILKLHEKKIL